MSRVSPANGCKRISVSIISNFNKLLSAAFVNDYGNVKKIAGMIHHEGDLLCAFFSQGVPAPISEIVNFCDDMTKHNRNSADNAEIMKKILPAFFELSKLNWDDYFNENINYDSVFLSYAKEYNYNEILENLASQFELLLPPNYNELTQFQQEDIEKIIIALRLCKDKSESAIANCLHIANEILLILFPKLELAGKVSQLASELPDALKEAKTKLSEIVDKTKEKLIRNIAPKTGIKALEMPQTPSLRIESKPIAGLLDTGENDSER